MSYYPQNLKSYVNRLAGYSSTTVKLSPLAGRVDATPRSTISVALPPSSIVLPQTFTMWFKGTTSGSTNSGSGTPTVLFPQNIESLINSVQVSVNSLNIDNGPGQNYGQLFNLITDYQIGGKKAERSLYQGARDIPAQPVNPANPPTLVNAATPNPVVPYVPWSANGAGVYDSARSQQFAISNWLGFLSSDQAFDTDLVGDTRINITLADTNVLVINELTTNPASISYTLSNLYFSVTTLSLASEYYSALSLFVDKGNVVERKMSLWWSYSGNVIQGSNAGQLGQPTGTSSAANGNATTTVNFSLASQSVDMLIGAFLTVPDTTRPFLCRFDADPSFFGANQSAFKGLAFKRPGNMIQDYQFSINSVNIPSYRIAASEAFQHLPIQIGQSNEAIQGTNPSIVYADQYMQAYWACAISLAAQAPADARLISGLTLVQLGHHTYIPPRQNDDGAFQPLGQFVNNPESLRNVAGYVKSGYATY